MCLSLAGNVMLVRTAGAGGAVKVVWDGRLGAAGGLPGVVERRSTGCNCIEGAQNNGPAGGFLHFSY